MNNPSLQQKDLLVGFSLDVLQEITESFYDELSKAKRAYEEHKENTTSLPFIVSKTASRSLVEEGELFQVFVMGGTMGKKAICKRVDDAVEILEKEEKEIPILEDSKSFFEYIISFLDSRVKVLVINFAYPITPILEDGYLDGILQDSFGEKTFRAKDLIGKRIGQEISRYVEIKTHKKIIVPVVNDTICLLYSGKKRSNNNIGCGIVGTGVNFGFALDDRTVVNIESAEFNKFIPSEAGKFLGQRGLGSPFGRETNGGLLYHHFNNALKILNIDFPPIYSTIQLQVIAEQESPIVSQLARVTLTKSAQLIACQAAGITKLKAANMKFIMEGGLFWGESLYKSNVEKIAVQLLPEYKMSFVKVYESGILGAAKTII